MTSDFVTPGMRSRVLDTVGVRPDEAKLVGWISSLFFLTQASHGVGVNTAFALFFSRFGVEELPLMIVLSGPAVMLAVLAHTTGLARLGDQRWMWIAAAASAIWALFEWMAVGIGGRFVYPLIWISTQVLVFVTYTLMWNAASSACDTRQGKRLFPFFATAGVAGGVFGNLVVGPLAILLGTANLLLVQSLLLLGSTSIILRFRRFLTAGDPNQTAKKELTKAVGAVRSSALLRLIAVVTFALSALFFLVLFPFSEEVAMAFETEEAMAGFLGLFSAVATAATFIFSLLVTNRLFSRFGLALTLLLVPVTYAAGFAVWLVGFGLATASAVRGAQWVAVNAIQGSGTSALFNVLPRRDRGPVMSLMTAVPAQLGTIVAGLILLASNTVDRQVQFAIGLVLSVASVAAVAAMRPAYVTAVITAVRRGFVSVFDPPAEGLIAPMDGDLARVLQNHLADARPEARALAAAGLGRMGDPKWAQSVEPLLADDEPSVRSAAFGSMCVLEPARLDSHIQRALEDEVPAVRLDALRRIRVGSTSGHQPSIERALSDPDERVRAAAAWLVGGTRGAEVVERMTESGGPIAVTAVLDEAARFPEEDLGVDPASFLDNDHPAVRASAARAVGAVGGDPARLVPALDDASIRVRNAGARSLAATNEGRSLLLNVLEYGSVTATEAALSVVASLDDPGTQLTGWAAREARRAALLDHSRRQISANTPESALLTRVLSQRALRLIQWVLAAMTTERTRLVMPVVARGVQSDDPETRSQALEALETVGDRNVLSVLLPLLEQREETDVVGEEAALERLSEDFDPWLSALARACLSRIASKDESVVGYPRIDVGDLASLTPVSNEHAEILSEMERMLILEGVGMFADLDPEDLLLIARQTSEVHFEAKEQIYRQGDQGGGLIIITRGEAIVSKIQLGKQVVVTTYGEGDPIGELTMLNNKVRSADVHAGDEGLDGLAMTKLDLVSILEERSSVAMGMLRTLASRLSDQT